MSELRFAITQQQKSALRLLSCSQSCPWYMDHQLR